MKNLLLLFTLVVLFIPSNLFSQEKTPIVIRGIVKDAATKLPLVGVNVYNRQTNSGTFTDEKGYYELSISVYPSDVEFSYIGYETKRIIVGHAGRTDYTIKLQLSTSNLPNVEIIAKSKIKKLTKKDFSCVDFLILEDKILLLKYTGIRDKYDLALVDIEGNEIETINIAGVKFIQELHKGCLGSPFLLTQNYVYQLAVDDDQIKMPFVSKNEEFKALEDPCVGTKDEYVYMKSTIGKGFGTAFSVANKFTHERRNISTIIDEQAIRQYEDEAAEIAFGNKVDNMGDISPGESRKIRRAQFKSSFVEQFFYNGTYTPLFVMKDRLGLFDHLNGIISLYTLSGDLIKTIPIKYHLTKNWKDQLFYDRVGDKVYALFNSRKGRALREISLEDGTVGYPIDIDKPFIEKMDVHDGYVYFTQSGVTPSQRNRVLQKLKL